MTTLHCTYSGVDCLSSVGSICFGLCGLWFNPLSLPVWVPGYSPLVTSTRVDHDYLTLYLLSSCSTLEELIVYPRLNGSAFGFKEKKTREKWLGGTSKTLEKKWSGGTSTCANFNVRVRLVSSVLNTRRRFRSEDGPWETLGAHQASHQGLNGPTQKRTN